MEEKNILTINNRIDFRAWLTANELIEKECWLEVKRGKPANKEHFWYLDAVEEALCFGWIDSTHKIINGKRMQKFSPRKKNSPWTELNKERARRLEKLGLMTDTGRAVLPEMDVMNFVIDADIEAEMKQTNTFEIFRMFPPLYQRVRIYNVVFYKKRNLVIYKKSLQHLIDKTKKNEMFGEWNDYGRLLNY